MAQSWEPAQAGDGVVTDHLAAFVAARYALAAHRLGETACENERWKLLRALCHGVVRLRRGDHLAESLRLQRQQLALRQPNTPAHPPGPSCLP